MARWNVDHADRLLGIVAECHKRKEVVKRKQQGAADGTASFVGLKNETTLLSVVLKNKMVLLPLLQMVPLPLKLMVLKN